MAANAPYYQMRSGQFIAVPNGTNAPAAHFAAEDDEYDLSTATVASPNEHHATFYSEHPMHQTSADTTLATMEENHNLADLLEAATTAAGQAAQAVDAHEAASSRPVVQRQNKRKRASSPLAEEAVVAPRVRPTIAPKRRRVDVPTDPQLQDTDHELPNRSEESSAAPPNESLLSNARAAGVHSAAALFRRTSERTSRKYTRPPMSKLFMSLQLSPENFLQLQAHAKAYMLDTAYPERQNCVGNRGKGDTDMVKLRLFNCVRDFLNDGVGEQFFGENVEKPGEREAIEAARALGEDQVPNTEERLTWPRDGNKIINLVTPLMRRMVTNERQRMYAIETRKGGTKKKDKEGSAEAATQQIARSPVATSTRGSSAEQQLLLPALDPNLSQHPHTSLSSPTIAAPTRPGYVPFADMGHSTQLPLDDTAEHFLTNINIFLVLVSRTLHDGSTKPGPKLDEKRICKELSQNLVSYPWNQLVAEIVTLLDRARARYPALRERAALPRKHSPTSNNVQDSPNHLTDNLQELAAAANAMQGDHVTRVGHDNPELDSTRLPAHVIKTIGPCGWEIIENAEQWANVLQQRVHEVWADGVVNVVVELVDLPVAAAASGQE